jgi:multidrug efflux pump subunit AcrA (membrane-fusion protein)
VKLPGGKKAIGAVIGILIIILLGYRLFWYRPTVMVVAVKQAEVRGEVQGPGTVQSKVPVAVSAKITGILEKLYADQPNRVQKGQLLAKLDSAELRAREAAAEAAQRRAQRDLIRGQADLLRSQANLALAESNYRRDLEVFKLGYISQAAFDTTAAQLKVAQSDVAATKATVTALEAAFKQAESDRNTAAAIYQYTNIVAPMDGLITVRKAEIGDTITPGTPIFQMVDLDMIWVATWIDETQIAALQEGQEARIRLRSGRSFTGTVVRVNKEADMVTRELEVDVKFAAPPEPLVVGEEAEVTVATGSTQALAVPWRTVLQQDGRPGVLVVEGGVVKFRPIKLGLRGSQQVAVEQGLQAGELVVAPPSQTQPGQKVRTKIVSGK